MLRVSIIIQARSTSQRFPNKMMAMINGKNLISHVYETCLKACNYKNRIFSPFVSFAVPTDDSLTSWLQENRISHTTGPEYDLIERYNIAIKEYSPDIIIRVTGDQPLLPTQMITTAMDNLIEYDYVSNTIIRTYYEGYDIQGCSIDAWNKYFTHQSIDREHPFRTFDMNEENRKDFLKLGFQYGQIINKKNINQVHLSVDYPNDIKNIENFLNDQKTR